MRSIALLIAFVFVTACATASAQTRPVPVLRTQGEAVQLMVDGAPFLILGGELANSSASNLDYLAPAWERFETLNMNTVLAPVSWELIEPREGAFDFTLVDGLLRDARAHDMRLVLLWFGSWKNSMSSYAPAWVKRDEARFPRARDANGVAQEIMSPFHDANWQADARAFAALMAHLRRVDSQRTVIMVQVENEIGMLPSARDHSDAANAAFNAAVPAEFWAALPAYDQLTPEIRRAWNGRTRGTWRESFGDTPAGHEMFMAWYFARYTDHVTRAGKAEYELPMFVNAALIRPGRAPGEYPSAGPLPHLRHIWEAGAPSIDFLAPDIYFPNFVEWMRAYDWPGNAFFIPEANQAGLPEAPANAFFSIGALDAIGFSPFSIDSIEEPENATLGEAYAVLDSLAPLILAHQGRGTMTGVRPPVNFDGVVDEAPQSVTLGDFTLRVTFIDPWTPRPQQNIAAHGGLILQLGPEEYLIAGSGITVTFSTPGAIAGIESIWEGAYEDGVWRPGRLLNGDQSHQGRHLRLPPGEWGVQRVRLYRYR